MFSNSLPRIFALHIFPLRAILSAKALSASLMQICHWSFCQTKMAAQQGPAARPAPKWFDQPHGNPRIDRTENWVGMETLGVGGNGVAGLWVRQDDAGNIIDRMVCKRIYWGDSYDRQPNYWVGQQHLPIYRPKAGQVAGTRMEHQHPREAYMHETLPDAENIVGYRGYSKQPELKTIRIFLDYCSHGNLNQ